MIDSSCKIYGCDRLSAKAGLCSSHYKLRNTPNANKTLQARAFGVKERLQLHTTEVGDCRLWTAGVFPNGYSKMNVSGKSKLAHRVAYELHFGAIPEGFEIHHTCQNILCVNPLHLQVSTRKQHLQLHNYPRDAVTGRFTSHEYP